ncbi:laminin subunit alpha-3-like isoform X1 [Anguilla rostrata]|uniref:laminin subunit alpha-3-like isoform X1 n=2 Tax=Anguilla rostrata TaxID=7938 RepID=UPI0030CF1902
MGWLLLLCAMWGLCPTGAQTPQPDQQSDWGGYDNHPAQVQIPRIHTHRGLRVCVPKAGQDCGPGFYRVRRGLHYSDCAPCKCNGLSECEDGTGRCLNCQYNTAGDHCEHCKEGYYGNAIQRTCRVCPCPYTVLSNSFATSCMELNEGFRCVCRPGYAGPRCERCAPGFYGDPLAFGDSCEPCNCDNGNPSACDSRTGECIHSLEPSDPDPGDQCQECDSCIQALLDALEGMDIELARLKTQLKNPSIGPIAQGRLEKLEEAITTTQDLVRKYKHSIKIQGSKVKELQADVNTLHADISQLGDKAKRILLNAQRGREKTRKTYQRAEHLVSDARLLFLSVQDLLEQLKRANASSSMVDTEELSRMVREAQKMVQEMKQHDCSAQKEAADREWEESSKLLRYIKNNITKPLVSNQGEVDRIADLLNWSMSKLMDLEVALKEANDIVGRATLQNSQNVPMLEDIQHRSKELGEVHNLVTGQIAMATDQLKGTAGLLKMLRDLKMGYERLVAQFDGARTELIKKVNTISQAASKEPIVVRAEEHAKELDKLARELQELVKNTTNSSDVRHAINAIGIYKNITDAVAAAKEAARQAKEAADKALSDVKGEDFPKKAKGLKDQAEGLLTKANDAQNEHEKSADEQATQINQLTQAQRKTEMLQQELLLAQNKLVKIGRDDIGAILDAAKANVASANNSINTATDKIDSIRDDLEKMNVSVPDLNFVNFLEDLNKTVSNLTATIPSLRSLLNRTEADSHLLPPKNNVSQSIRRIKELIWQARDAANRISVPVDFSGDGFVELRPPSDLENLKAYTNLAFSLQRPVLPTRIPRQKPAGSGNMFVLYLGNRNSSKDYIGMALRDNVLYCVYMLGGAEHQIKSSSITESPAEAAFFDRVNFHRIYQDVEVNLTKSFTSSNPHPPQSSSSQGDSTGTLLDLDPGEVVFYVGGYPDKIFTPPASLRDHEKYTGCIEFSTFNDRFISLYNFKNVSNINRKPPCGRYSQGHISRYFEGTGYAKGTIKKQQDLYVFFQLVLSHSENAMIFYIGNEDSYYSVIVEKGYIVLRWKVGNNVMEQKSPEKEFPMTKSKEIQVVLLGNQKKILVRVTGRDVITSKYTQGVYNSYYIGGLAPSLRERYNITATPFKGCMTNIKLDNIVVKFEDEIGVGLGCSSEFLAIRESTFGLGGFLSAPPRGFKLTADVTISLGFRSMEKGGILLKNSQESTDIELSLVDGFVEFKLNNKALKSNRLYNDGKWHYLTVEKRGSRIEMRVDKEDSGQVQPLSSSVPAKGQDVLLGNGTFQGCLTNLYMRRPSALYKPEDLSAFNSSGDVFVGFCAPERPSQFILANGDQKRARSARKREVWRGASTAKCSLPSAVKRAYHLGGPTSHLSYNITPQVLNHRHHFSLAFRTRSAEGLLLFVGSKRGHCHVALYMTKGRVKLSVGGNRPIAHKEKCNDGKWHTVMFSLEMYTFHLVVDHRRAMDGVLSRTNGSSLELQPPVFLGSLPQSTYTGSQMLFPRDSVVGCIRNFKMNSQWIEELPANHGAPLCFDGNTERGTYFSGNGAYAALDCPNSIFMGVDFHLEFEVRPRNLTGILLHIRDQHHPHLALFMKKGEVVLQVSGAAGESNVSVTQDGLCDALFHRVTVSRKKTGVQLTVDQKSGSTRVSSFSGTTNECHLYAGGVPDTLQYHKLPVKSSLIGCIRNLRINGKSISLGETSQVFGPVNLQECPSS